MGIAPAGSDLQISVSPSHLEGVLMPLMLFLVQVGVEMHLEDCQSSQEQEAKLHKATVDKTDRAVQKMIVLQGSITQLEVLHILLSEDSNPSS